MSEPVDRAYVAKVSDLPPGTRRLVDAFGTKVVVFNLDGRLFAVDNRCPHHGGPLCHGRVAGTYLPSQPYEYRWGMENTVLRCPWHGWEFNLESGASLFDPSVRLATYSVGVEDGQVVLYDTPPSGGGDPEDAPLAEATWT